MMDSIFFISDIDGTIYREKKVTEEELFFLNSVSKRYPIVLATGRNYAMFHRFIQEYSFEYEYCILNNVALVMDKNGSILVSLNMKTNMILPLVQEMLEKKEIIINMTFSHLQQNIFLEGIHSNNFLKRVSNIPLITNSVTLEINGYKELFNELDIFTKAIERTGFQVNRNKKYIDISPLGSGKASAIICLGNLVKIDVSNSIIVGDELNDKEMLMLTEKSYCMVNGNSELFTVANNIIRSLTEISLKKEEQNE